MAEISLVPIGKVVSSRQAPVDDNWDSETCTIILDKAFSAETLIGLDEFSHIEVIFYLHEVKNSKVCLDARHPRNNPAWPRVGIFAQRGKNRPNRLGATICEIVFVDGNKVRVKGLDAIDGTPIIDIKPVMQEYLARGEVKQPSWSKEMMADYWEQ